MSQQTIQRKHTVSNALASHEPWLSIQNAGFARFIRFQALIGTFTTSHANQEYTLNLITTNRSS